MLYDFSSEICSSTTSLVINGDPSCLRLSKRGALLIYAHFGREPDQGVFSGTRLELVWDGEVSWLVASATAQPTSPPFVVLQDDAELAQALRAETARTFESIEFTSGEWAYREFIVHVEWICSPWEAGSADVSANDDSFAVENFFTRAEFLFDLAEDAAEAAHHRQIQRTREGVLP